MSSRSLCRCNPIKAKPCRSTAVLVSFFLAVLLAGPPHRLGAAPNDSGVRPTIEKASFGTTKSGQAVELYTLRNASGLTAKVMTYGAIIYSLEVPDRDGRLSNVNANRETLGDYEARSFCFGSLIGRYANRIAHGRFTLDGRVVKLACNGGEHHIHGGAVGFDKRVWRAEPITTPDAVALKLSYRSPDGEEGYPGTLDCVVLYELNNRNEWKMDYSARTDKPTVVNLSNHSYWNLAGAQSGTVLDQELTVNADRFLAVDNTLIPTGGTLPVEGTPMDFRTPRPLGARIGQILEKQFNGGYDHCLVLNHLRPRDLTFAARLKDPRSGRVMEVRTTEPGLQIYSANFPTGSVQGPNGYSYPEHAGLCLETQHYPDSPNHPEFPSTTLLPGQTYHSTTVHSFSVDKL